MITNVVQYLERSAERFPNKISFADENRQDTFSELLEKSRIIGSALLDIVLPGMPAVVYMQKSVAMVETLMGVVYSGGFYVPMDTAMPEQRVKTIIEVLHAKVVITAKDSNLPESIASQCEVFYYEDLVVFEADRKEELQVRQNGMISTDPIYTIFTSGSTGVPKGVVVSQQSVINFTEWYCTAFDFTDKEIFGNQTPFYFDASVKDIYATISRGATCYIIPKKLFSMPAKLIEYLNQYKINAIDWVPSVLCMIVNFNTFAKVKPEYLKKVLFLGEVMPTKQFNMWRREFPEIQFANIYGPTEATSDCTYYKIERELADTEPIPIGKACENTQILILNEQNELASVNEIGEICVRGISLALGYYNNFEKTDTAFVQNPLQKNYYEKIYRTGDLGKWNEHGEIIYVSRKDYQIKHMGHRIELGEIETAISSLQKVQRSCCLYNKKTQKIVAFYEGEIENGEIIEGIENMIPRYMIPNVFYKLDALPLNMNGKIDRKHLEEEFFD